MYDFNELSIENLFDELYRYMMERCNLLIKG